MSLLHSVLGFVSTWSIPLFLVGIPLYGLARGVKVYAAFVEGAKEGFEVGVRIIPYLVAILAAVGAFRASGALDALARVVGPYTDKIGLPPVALPMVLVRPLSGGAAKGIVAGIFNDPSFGPDSYAGRLVSVMSGSTETTFYVLAVYFGAVGVTRYRHALPAALMADLAGFGASIAVCLWFFGR